MNFCASFVAVASSSSCNPSDSPLCALVQCERTALHCAAEEGNEATCLLLIDKGADLSAKDNVPLPLYTVNRKLNRQSQYDSEVNLQ
jgi:hypothetical protein